MKKSILLALFMAMVIGFTGCGSSTSNTDDANQSKEETPLMTLSIIVKDSKSDAIIENAKVTFFDANGSTINETESYTSDNEGKVDIEFEVGERTLSAKVVASAHVNQVAVIKLTKKSLELTKKVSLLPVGGTVSPVSKGENVDTNGTGAKVDITGAVFKDKNGDTVTPASIDFSILNPITDPDSFPGTADIKMPDGSAGIMVSSGMMDVVFRDENGDALVLDENTPVSITMPLFSNINPETNGTLLPGDSVKFWSMDDKTGQWKEETTATVVSCSNSPIGICAEGNVTHFSWWNTDFARSASTLDSIIINSDTNETLDDINISSITLHATFTAATSDAGNYGTTAVRQTSLLVEDTISYGDNFDIVFLLEIKFKDGSSAVKKYTYTAEEVLALDRFELRISTTDIYKEISLTSYETEYTQYRNYPIYITRTLLGVDKEDVQMAVNGIVGGDAEVGTIVCLSYGNYCTYTKGTEMGDMNISAQGIDDENLSDSLIITIRLSLAIKTTYSYSYISSYTSFTSYVNNYDKDYSYEYSYDNNYSYSYEYSYYNTNGLFLNNHLLANAEINSSSSYIYNGAKHEIVLNADDTNLTGYVLSVDCETNAGDSCEEENIFVAPFTFKVTDLPESINRGNRYYLKATQIADPTISAQMPVYYY
ncbi:MAG: hypothetical protein QM493_09525 [Sulfurovum sp.]